MNKTVLTSFTILCLLPIVFLMGLSFNIQPVKASGTIYIRADGSVEGTTNIVTADNVTYTLNATINDSIVVERSNIIIDGAGHTVNGPGAGPGFNLTNINNATIKNTQIKQFNQGVYLISSFNNTVSGNNITNNHGGVYLSWSDNNMVSGNNITNNNFGVSLSWDSSGNTVSGNNITNNDGDGVFLRYSSGNTVSGNNITNNILGVYALYSSDNNMVSGNNITNNHDGVYLRYSSGNTVSGNNITNNIFGVSLDYSSDNRFYHNNLINNTDQVYSKSSVNIWDDGYPSGGNYWSDYVDKYPDGSELDGSGLWDTPYVIDDDNQDNYPMIPEFTSAVLLTMFIMLSTTAIALAKRKTATKSRR